MTALPMVLVNIAVALLPENLHTRYQSEWRSEVYEVQRSRGALAGFRFASQLLIAAPRVTMVVRANSASAYLELSIAALLSLLPAVVLVVLAIVFQVWVMLIVQLGYISGSLLVALGFWRDDGRLLDSVRSRIGLALVVFMGAAGVAIMQLTELGPRVDERVNVAIPNMFILFGLALLASSNYAGRFRRRVQLLAITIVSPSAAVSVVAAFINAWALSGVQRLVVLIYVLPASVLAWACYSIAGRTEVFGEATDDGGS